MTLVASRPLAFLDAACLPYSVEHSASNEGLERLGRVGGPELLWPSAPAGSTGAIEGIPVFAPIADDASLARLAARTGRRWSGGTPSLHADDGSILLGFDPDAAIEALLREAYVPNGRSGRTAVARTLYYRARPLLPRTLQLTLRRRFTHIQERATFPHWPVETAVHDLYALLLGLVDEIAGEPMPRLAPWPGGKTWTVVLTHDVERAPGYDNLDRVLDLERSHGLRSAVYLVPERDYRVHDALVDRLWDEGFEVGVHGLRHDGRDLAQGTFARRLPSIRRWAERWRAVGFRSPATHRSWDLMPRLGFDYDTSYSDVARYEPQPGGCCSWLPFFIDGMVELPITLPMDHTLFELLGHRDVEGWVSKSRVLRGRGGMALLLTHPDYMLTEERLSGYDRFLSHVGDDGAAWHVLPRDLSAWWRRRAASTIERDGERWRVRGPAAGEARIEFGPLT